MGPPGAVTVEIEWIGRRLADLPRRTWSRLWFTRDGRDARRRRRGKDRWWDALEFPAGLDLEDVFVTIVAAVGILVLVLLWELLLGALLLAVLEFLVLVPVALAVLAGKVLLGRPWRVVLRAAGVEVAHVDVRGLRRARATRDDLRRIAAAGDVPTPATVAGMFPPR
jgi:hypothetical protein